MPSRQCSMKNDSGPRQCFETHLFERQDLVDGRRQRSRGNAVASKLLVRERVEPGRARDCERAERDQSERRPGREIARDERRGRADPPPAVLPRLRMTSPCIATAGHTDGNIIADIISTQRTTKNPSDPTENRDPMSIASIRWTLAAHAAIARMPSTITVASRRRTAGEATGASVLNVDPPA